MPIIHEVETRTIHSEVRAASDGTFSLQGVASSYNTPTRIKTAAGDFLEQVAPGAFSQSLKSNADVKCNFNHSADHVLGRTKSGTLVLTDSSTGLRFNCALDKTNSIHRDVYQAVQAKNIDECSFAFKLQDDGSGDEWTTTTDENGRSISLRTLRNVQLVDVCPCTYPAYSEGTSVSARTASAAAGHRPSPRKTQTTAATYGFSSDAAMQAADLANRRSVLRAQASRINADTDRDLRARAERCRRIIEADAALQVEEDELRNRMEIAAGRTCRTSNRAKGQLYPYEQAGSGAPEVYPYAELAAAVAAQLDGHKLVGADSTTAYVKHTDSGMKFSAKYSQNADGSFAFQKMTLGGHPSWLTAKNVS